MFQMGGIGPMFGQIGFFNKFAGKDYEDKRPHDRYVAESRRLLNVLNVLNGRLAGRSWIMGDAYTIADMATFPWVHNLVAFTRRAIWWASAIFRMSSVHSKRSLSFRQL
jgi:GST-like protein